MTQQVDLLAALKQFNISHFREGQEEIITDVMLGKDVLGVLPTGSGKSLCFQLPAKLLPGTTIVVSPLISLMMDQVKQLKAAHFKEVIAITSFMEWSERLTVYQSLQSYKLIYVSPEILQNNELLTYLKKLTINLFVVDEAHCISQWGHEFRPDYLKLEQTISLLGYPPVLALSATVTEDVKQDIIHSLKRPQMVQHIYPIDRDNIAFVIHKVSAINEKLDFITSVLKKKKVSTVIYFSSRKATEEVADKLSSRLPDYRIAFYHGKMDQYDRLMIQQQFMHDQIDVVCCTSAFGMGVNKANIHLIIHYHLPNQVESFIQEVGRAGRDGEESVSILLYNEADVYLPKKMIENELPSESMITYAFKALFGYAETQAIIPTNENEIELTFGLNETQWRFLKSHLEKHHIVKNNKVLYGINNWRQTKEKISLLAQERYHIKQSKLHDMVEWVNENDCLRDKLYETFQKADPTPQFQCCSNCGFSLNKWNIHQKVETSKKRLTWEEKLQNIFMIEEKS